MTFVTVRSLLRSNTSRLSLTTLPAPSEPVVPPVPIWSVPEEIVVVPA